MLRWIVLALGLAAMSGPSPLAPLRWEARVLLVAAPSLQDEAREDQIRLIETAGFNERQMALVSVTQGAVYLHVPADGVRADRLRALFPDGLPSAEAMRTAYDLPADGFAAVLVGFDGGVKARWSEPVDMEELFSRIDAMPMRRQEIRRGEE